MGDNAPLELGPCNQSINQSIKIYLTLPSIVLQGDNKVAWAIPKPPPKKT